jgi:hypothetical protein
VTKVDTNCTKPPKIANKNNQEQEEKGKVTTKYKDTIKLLF